MYKLLIADDEKIIREGLLKLIDWSELGFEIVKTLSDGEEVIDFLESEHVDVVLTDIMMPHVSGIEIAKYVYESKMPCKVVFISAYKKFEFAHQAIKFGVENYILKPSKIEEVVAVFESIRKELDIKAKDQREREKIREHWEETKPVLIEKFINSLVLSGELTDKSDVERRMLQLFPEVDSETSPCVLATIKIKDYDRFLRDRYNHSAEQFDDEIYTFVCSFREFGYFHIVYKVKNIVRIFAIVSGNQEQNDAETHAVTQIVDCFLNELTSFFKIEASVEIEQVYKNIYQVVNLRKELFSDIQQDAAALQLQFQEQKKLITTKVMNGNFRTAHKIFIKILQDNVVHDMHDQRHIFLDILSDVVKLLQENDHQMYQGMEPFIQYQLVQTMNTTDALMQYCDKLFEKMRQFQSTEESTSKLSMVDSVKKYVHDHIYEDVALEDVAGELFVTTTHLRRIFKKQTGETFLQYVTRKKMEKAAQLLLDPRYKVYQVSARLGYNTPRYFSKLFYGIYGYYPQQYRKDVLKLENFDDETEQN